nr:YesL family protein [Aquibacillus albus]
MGTLYSITEWISRFAFVNILWIAFSFVGLILLGFFPATIAMFAIVRKWIRGESEIPVFKTFWFHYKKEFIKGNILGLILVLFFLIIYVDLQFLQVNNNSFWVVTHIPIYLFILAFLFTLLYLFPVYVHFDIKLYQIFKNAFLIMVINPLSNFLMIIGMVATYFAMTAIPGLAFFFGGSFLTYCLMWPANRAFEKVENKKNKDE